MKINNIVTSAALVLSSAAFVHAQSANYGDLIAGFEASSGTGAATNIEVDVGSVTSFINAGPGVYSLANLSSDLSATYGASWATDSNLSYGVVGAVSTGANNPLSPGVANRTIWATNNSGAAYASGTTNNGAVAAIGTMYTVNANSGGFGGSNTSSLSDLSSQTNQLTGAAPLGLSVASQNAGASFFTQDAGNAFSVGGATDFTLLTAVNAPQGVALDQLLSVAGGTTATALAGTFTLTSAGVLEFVVIPEPSTYAAILGIISIGFVMLRRRNKVLA